MDNNNSFYTHVTHEHELFAKTKSCEHCKHKQRCSRYLSYKNDKSHFGVKPYGCFNYHQSDDDVYLLVKYKSMHFRLLISYIW